MNDDTKLILLTGGEELGLGLSSSQLGKFHAFAAELKKWNRKINLTSISGDEEIVVKHFLDSLTLLRLDGIEGKLLDIGSGGGFPAIPLKIARPALEVVSVDAVGKKIIFQRHLQRLLGLHGFEAIHARAEELTGLFSGFFDTVVSRAFTDIHGFARIALPLISFGGRIIAMKGKGGREEAETAEPFLKEIGAVVKDIQEFRLPHSGDQRSLIVIGRRESGISQE